MPLLSTVATDVLLELQVRFGGPIGLDCESKPFAENRAESPCRMVSDGGEMIIALRVAGEGSVLSDLPQPAIATTATAHENPRIENAIPHSS